MKILVLSLWSIRDGITQATVFPLLNTIRKKLDPQLIILCTVETSTIGVSGLEKILHIPLTTKGRKADKALDLFRFPLLLRRIVKAYSIDCIWCKGSPAGGLGSLLNVLNGIFFVVDSFEPHRDYMVQCGTWAKTSSKAFIAQWLEWLTRKRAALIFPVSHEYHRRLKEKGVDVKRMFMLPCVVDEEQFAFKKHSRVAIRDQFRLSNDCLVGIYVGKFGGLYYGDEAFQLYKKLFDYFKKEFFLIIISEMDRDSILDNLRKHWVPAEKVFVSKVNHALVSGYLSAADFAISTIKSVPAMRFCSPIKHGEYWAADLPILSTLSVGDDAEIIRREEGGVIIDVHNPRPDESFAKLASLLKNGRNGTYSRLAVRYRSKLFLERAIEFAFSTGLQKDGAAINTEA